MSATIENDVNQALDASIQLDNEGDPLVQWDIITDDGIPSGVFLHAFRRFGEVADTLAETIFEDQ